MKRVIQILSLSILFAVSSTSYAQCAMCKMNAENADKANTLNAKRLNSGILYLLALPYVAAGVLGFAYYKRQKRQKALKFEEIA